MLSRQKFFVAAILFLALISVPVLALAKSGNASQDNKPKVEVKIKKIKVPKRISFQGKVISINSLDYVVQVTKKNKKASSTLASIVTIHTTLKAKNNSQITLDKFKNFKLNNNSALSATLSNMDSQINSKTVKVGDRVKISGVLNTDGSIGKSEVVVISVKNKK